MLLPHWERKGAGSGAEGFLLKIWLHTGEKTHKTPSKSTTAAIQRDPLHFTWIKTLRKPNPGVARADFSGEGRGMLLFSTSGWLGGMCCGLLGRLAFGQKLGFMTLEAFSSLNDPVI